MKSTCLDLGQWWESGGAGEEPGGLGSQLRHLWEADQSGLGGSHPGRIYRGIGLRSLKQMPGFRFVTSSSVLGPWTSLAGVGTFLPFRLWAIFPPRGISSQGSWQEMTCDSWQQSIVVRGTGSGVQVETLPLMNCVFGKYLTSWWLISPSVYKQTMDQSHKVIVRFKEGKTCRMGPGSG